MILGTAIALVIVVAIFAPRRDEDEDEDACPRCGRDFDDEADTGEYVDGSVSARYVSGAQDGGGPA